VGNSNSSNRIHKCGLLLSNVKIPHLTYSIRFWGCILPQETKLR
jgi:hypothetical protein